MTRAMIDAAGSGFVAAEAAGPLEQRHLQYANYRAVADSSKITRTHWHIALANGLGWGFDGMNGVLFELLSPLIINEFALDIPTYRSGFQIWLNLGITGLYVWPWLADRFGRRRLLAVNIAMFSVMMPIVALSPGFSVFIAARALSTFAMNGEWALGSMLVAETWPAHLRGRVISINRATWCFGASTAGAILGLIAGTWGLARSGHGAGRHRSARDLSPRDLPGIALLSPLPGPDEAYRRHACRRRRAECRGPNAVHHDPVACCSAT